MTTGRPVFSINRVVAALRSVDWGSLGVEWVVLYGSLARRGKGRDVDLLVDSGWPGRWGLSWLLEVVMKVAEALQVDPSLVDVAEFKRAPRHSMGGLAARDPGVRGQEEAR